MLDNNLKMIYFLSIKKLIKFFFLNLTLCIAFLDKEKHSNMLSVLITE